MNEIMKIMGLIFSVLAPCICTILNVMEVNKLSTNTVLMKSCPTNKKKPGRIREERENFL